MKKTVENLWNILEDCEDFIKYGYKRTNRKKFTPAIVAAVNQADKNISVNQNQPHNENAKTFDSAVQVKNPEAANDSLKKIAQEISVCEKCNLCRTRRNSVPGMGMENPLVLVVGEAPGADEDIQGLPFVGAAGKYLDEWLAAISLGRGKNCFIANVIKCRPPQNRDPEAAETDACIAFLKRQIDVLKPKAILTVGRISSAIISGEPKTIGIGKLRGKIYKYNNIPVFVTYHPSAVLRDNAVAKEERRGYKKAAWEDLQFLQRHLADAHN